ncbi:MAG TPA: tRNA (adenosine(37)-N6)-dimethylallyltransferase MiaA [Bacteroidia bacterium]|nr:tRNA (adenosine(37)-N6)-dimethylallyltransferase MiaA [Bacteroidia bacterium]
MSKKLLIAIVGPTAVGKTAVAIDIAQKFHTEIVSADSRQFYREMEIGTAKPTVGELNKIPHHFINNLSVHDEYNAGKYEKEALTCLTNLFKTHDKVILAGGSGLFVNALCNGFDELPDGDTELRTKYEKVLKEEGIVVLQKEVEEKDPEYYSVVDKNNPRRLIRALEVIHQTGLPYSQFRKKKTVTRDFSIRKIGLQLDKEVLRERIDKRVDEMLANGWLDECKKLYEYRELNALRTVGYTELFDFIAGKNDWNTTVENIKTNTWHYAKRQLTWFKKDGEIKWFSPNDMEGICRYIES